MSYGRWQMDTATTQNPHDQAHDLTCAETAKIIRAALKRQFPTIKFSVRSDTYSMGASIRVAWTDGPSEKRVEAIAGQYDGEGFDGSIDLSYSILHWLHIDGSASIAYTLGTEGNRGCHPAINNPRPAGTRLVQFGSDSVECSRHYSRAFLTRIAEQVCELHASGPVPEITGCDEYGYSVHSLDRRVNPSRSWSDYLDHAIHRAAADTDA